ncbi:MAG: DUF4160 domain-containing protein [Xanthobacteraceae bacterium]|jgi:hypothetical protein
MPTVLRWASYRAFFYSNERDEPAHVHVRKGNKEVKIWLRDLTVALNIRFATHEIGDIIRYLREHRGELLRAWNAHFGN